MEENNIWIIGAGGMAREYIKVLKAMDKRFSVIGRGEESASECEKETGVSVFRGGIDKNKSIQIPEYAIVAVNPLNLASVSKRLLEIGVKKLLIEKPGGMSQCEMKELSLLAKEKKADVYVAYNRRCYASVLKAQELIKEDGGVTSFNFEFTEWGHVISQYNFPSGELEEWFLANSTHVVDLAFYLGGIPNMICSFCEGSLPWHSKASKYAGAGKTTKGVLFSYKANWESAGRWSLEVLTKKRKLIFEPLERLKVQEKGTVSIVDYNIDDKLDKEFKPGLFYQTRLFFDDDKTILIDIEKQAQMANLYAIMDKGGVFSSEDGWNTYHEV